MSNRSYLKAATRRVHDQAEASWVGASGFSDLSTYRRWLSAMHEAHCAHGLSSARILGMCLGQEQQRLSALQTDLGLATGLRCKLGADRSPSWAWGVQYTLNGSALGASMLLKAGIDGTWPVAYLTRMQAFATSGGFAAFLVRLNAAEIDLKEATEGAMAAFPKHRPARNLASA